MAATEHTDEPAVHQEWAAYEAALEMAQVVLWVYDIRAHRITMADTAHSKDNATSLGLNSVIENVPQSLLPLIDEADRTDFLRMYDQVHEGNDASCQFRYAPVPGKPDRYGEVSYRVVCDDDGEAMQAYGVELDATRFVEMSRKLADADAQLRSKSQFYERIYEAIPLGIMQCTVEADPIILNGNPASFEILGFSEADLHQSGGKHVYDTVYPDDVDIVQRYNHALAMRGQDSVSVSYTHRIVTPAGDVRTVAMTSQLMVDDRNEPVFTVLMHDITEIEELRRVTDQQNSFERRSFLEAIRAVYSRFMVIDLTENRYSLVDNDRYDYKIPVAGDFDKLMGDSMDSIVEEYRDRYRQLFFRESLLSAARAGVPEVSMELRQTFDGGLEHWLEVRTLLLHDEERDKYVAVSLIQVTDREHEELERHQRELREALARAEAANEAKSEFLSRMSHDIRTPLNGVLGMTRIAQEQVNPAATEDALQKIDASSRFLLGLVNDILDLSKVEGGRMELNPEPYSKAEFFGYLDQIIRPSCEQKGVEFTAESRGISSDAVPMMDKLRTNQILFNLLSNAVKYTPEGGHVHYLVVEHRLSKSRMGIDMVVSDDGIGMSHEFQKHLFEPFTQEHGIQKNPGEGSGLGLAIVSRLVDLMDGTIEVKSAPGCGSTFTVHVDADCVPISQIEQAKREADTSDGVDFTGRHVLLCEDHPLNVEIAVHMLEQKGMMVTVAEDGQRGVDAFAASPIGYYDAILMDIRMPVMTGLEATRAIRALDRSDGATVPIIAMTADAFDEDVRNMLDSGMDAHVAKPVEPDILFETLARFCR